jgi:hypothetical protein
MSAAREAEHRHQSINAPRVRGRMIKTLSISVCDPLIFRTMDAPDRDLCHRYTDRRLRLARDHDRVQPTFAGVTAREPRVWSSRQSALSAARK